MNILITAAGSGGTNGILKSYNNSDFNFIGVNSNYYKAAASSLTKYVYQVENAVNEKKYVGQLNHIIEKHNIDFIIPNSDIEVEVISKNKHILKAKSFVPSYNEILISNDKLKTYNHCIKNNINVPLTIDFDSNNSLKEKFKIFKNFPLWCRIKEGAGSKHTSPIYSLDEAIEFITGEIDKSDLKITDFTISDYLPGDDCLISSIWKNGELKFMGMAHRMKYANKPGQSPPVVIKKMYREELFHFAKKVIATLSIKPNGIYNIDVKYDADNEIALTEFNLGRFYYNMQLFNSDGTEHFFKYYMDSVVLNQDLPSVICKNEVFFLRDQDNYPVILTEKELNNKVIILE
jgi:carbamoylphosphate synthase large subunit